MRDVVLVGAARTPIGSFLGALAPVPAPKLGAVAIKAAIERAGLTPADIGLTYMGCVLPAGLGQAPARQASIGAGIPPSVGAVTVNKVCGSGLKAVMLADQGIRAGDVDVVVAGGMESMSHAPYLLTRVRDGLRLGNAEVVDAMITDGLWCAFEQCHMGNAGDVVATEYGVDRAAQDEYAFNSHRKAAEATESGFFKDEILPVSIPQRKGAPVIVDRDEPIRADTTVAALAHLEPAFNEDGSVTAGNAPGVNDGAAALVVMSEVRARSLGASPLARIVAQAASGLAPKYVLMAPVEAARRAAEKAGWRLEDVDLFELNEAFSVQAVAVLRELGIDPARVNVHGGAVALGHPIGASGARILTTLLYAMKRRNAARGIATLCLGGGNGVALAIERV